MKHLTESEGADGQELFRQSGALKDRAATFVRTSYFTGHMVAESAPATDRISYGCENTSRTGIPAWGVTAHQDLRYARVGVNSPRPPFGERGLFLHQPVYVDARAVFSLQKALRNARGQSALFQSVRNASNVPISCLWR